MSDCYNHLFGQCVNSVNTRFISGGSSGGEASLIAAQGSIVGIGSDLGGSVRIPAALCGIYGLSPTTGRHPYEQSGYVNRLLFYYEQPSNLGVVQSPSEYCAFYSRPDDHESIQYRSLHGGALSH